MKGSTHVIVIGAGVIGCAAAYELARRGARVTVLDRRGAGLGATQASAGVLAPCVLAHQGTALQELGRRSLALYDEFVSRAVEDSGVAVQYARNGTLEVACDATELARLRALDHACAASGVAVDYVDEAAIGDAEPQLSDEVLGGLLVHEHGLVSARDLVRAVRRAGAAHGVELMTTTAAVRITGTRDGVRVDTGSDVHAADHVVVAAGSWSGQIEVAGEAALPITPVRGQLLHLHWPKAPLTRVVWTERTYLVPWTDGSVLVGATVEDVGFDERATVSGVQDLVEAACRLVPLVRDAWLDAVRVGLRPATPDRLPIIGASSRAPRVVYATGHYRNGVLLAPLTAAIVAGLVLDGQSDPACAIVSPARFGEATS